MVDEMIVGGLVVETSPAQILEVVDAQVAQRAHTPFGSIRCPLPPPILSSSPPHSMHRRS